MVELHEVIRLGKLLGKKGESKSGERTNTIYRIYFSKRIKKHQVKEAMKLVSDIDAPSSPTSDAF